MKQNVTVLLQATAAFPFHLSLRQDLSLAHFNYFCLDCEDCSDNSSASSSNSGECDHTAHPRRTLKDIEEVAAHIKSTGHSKFQPVQNFVNVKGCYSVVS